VKNQQGFYTLVNQAIAAAYGKTIEEVIGKTDRELLINPEEAAQFGNDDQQVINLVEPLWIPEELITLPSGEQKILQTHKIPIAAPDGNSYEVLGVATDITDRKRAEEEIQKALQKEKELGEMKSQFVDIVSHEFRTPLTSILGFAELLDRHYFKLSKEKQLHYIRNIQQAGIRLKDLIDDVLCISRAESGRLAVMPTALNLNLFCQNLLEEFRFGSGKEHHFHFQVQGLSQENVRLDERLLRHILTNLLANAIKYSTAGSTVELELTWLAEVVQFQIRDRGIGIPLEDQLHLFESFHRASNVGDIPGTGLGLSIVKRYIELQAGSLEFISVVNEGTTFRVMLPFSPMP
jgi:PAS domain S-box-containing protein